MNGGKGNGEASKDVSDSVDTEMNEEMVEDEGKVVEEEKLSDERVIEEKEEGENGQTTNEDLQSKQHVGADNEVNAVDDTKNGDEEGPECENNDNDDDDCDDNEKEDEPKDSEHVPVDMQSEIPVSDKSVDHDVEGDEKNCERNEESSAGPRDEQHSPVISKDDDNGKCENGAENSCAPGNGAENSCAPGNGAGRDAVLGGSSAADVENPATEVKVEENTTEAKMLVDKMEKINDVSMAMGRTPRNQTIMFDDASEGSESGTEEEQSAFIRDLETLLREKNVEFKVPKFYGVPVNLLKLWRSVIKLGGYDKVTACKLWRQVGESFNPPKTCTTVSFTFRIFYEKALLEYERHKIMGGEIDITPTVTEPVSMGSPANRQIAINSQASGSGRARRDAAARAMQGWHSQRLLGNGEASDPVIKEKGSIPSRSREKHLKNIGGQKQKKPLVEPAVKVSRSKLIKGPSDTAVPVVDIGPPADWVKINVRTTKDCYEVYALVPGLLREEVRVQSDPAGRLVISGEPEHPDNPWGVTPFRKVVTLPSRIDPHQTSAVVTLHGQLFVRVPFEQSD